jgi:hypothetical protein
MTMKHRKTTSDVPATMTGRVIGRLPEIEAWFRAGFKTREVHARLANEGIRLHPANLSALLSSYGTSEAQVRRAVAIESGATNKRHENTPPAPGAGKPTAATAALKQREAARGRTFRPNPSPRAEDLI